MKTRNQVIILKTGGWHYVRRKNQALFFPSYIDCTTDMEDLHMESFQLMCLSKMIALVYHHFLTSNKLMVLGFGKHGCRQPRCVKNSLSCWKNTAAPRVLPKGGRTCLTELLSPATFCRKYRGLRGMSHCTTSIQLSTSMTRMLIKMSIECGGVERLTRKVYFSFNFSVTLKLL